jgi:hypothetical protein
MNIIMITEQSLYEHHYWMWSTNFMNVINDYGTNCVIIITEYGEQCLWTPVLHMEHNLCEYFGLQKQILPQIFNIFDLSNLNSSAKTAQFALLKDTALERITICIKPCCFLESYTVTSILSSATYCCYLLLVFVRISILRKVKTTNISLRYYRYSYVLG